MATRRRRFRAATAIVLTSALGAASLRPAWAHDATDTPAGGGTGTPSTTTTPAPASPTPAPATPAPPLVFPAGNSHRPPALVIGAGALAMGLGAWLTYEETRTSNGPCTFAPPEGRASCPSPSLGPGIGVALLVLGAGAVVGGTIWYHKVTQENQRSVAILFGPSSMALRATF
jgi:hypothetical protein